MKTLITLATISLIFCDYNLGKPCSSKKLLTDDYFLDAEYYQSLQGDYKVAFYDVASCVSLKPDTNDGICCYMKIKYKLDPADAHYTHRGCVNVPSQYFASSNDFEAYEQTIENSITNNYATTAAVLSDVKVNIDCSSKFIKLAGLIVLFLLL